MFMNLTFSGLVFFLNPSVIFAGSETAARLN